MTAQENHNRLVPDLVRRMVDGVGAGPELNVLVESLLLGVAMINFPGDARRQALIIQEISDAAQDRAAGLSG